MSDEKIEDESMSAPCFFTAEEIQHVNMACNLYKKMIEKTFPEGDLKIHVLSVCESIAAELQNANGKL